MLTFKHNALLLREAFNLSAEDERLAEDLILSITEVNRGKVQTTRYIERVWADERLSDNAKVFLIFQAGRFVEFWNLRMRGEGSDLL